MVPTINIHCPRNNRCPYTNIDNRKNSNIFSTCPHNMVNCGPLAACIIVHFTMSYMTRCCWYYMPRKNLWELFHLMTFTDVTEQLGKYGPWFFLRYWRARKLSASGSFAIARCVYVRYIKYVYRTQYVRTCKKITGLRDRTRTFQSSDDTRSDAPVAQASMTNKYKNSSRDEIANVNFLRWYRTRTSKYQKKRTYFSYLQSPHSRPTLNFKKVSSNVHECNNKEIITRLHGQCYSLP